MMEINERRDLDWIDRPTLWGTVWACMGSVSYRVAPVSEGEGVRFCALVYDWAVGDSEHLGAAGTERGAKDLAEADWRRREEARLREAARHRENDYQEMMEAQRLS